jgi:AcrR family transcriptional regulator
MAKVRPYGGVQARDRVAERRRRLLDAGLEVLAGAERAIEPTVRAICAVAGISMRYFYESFSDKDALVAAVFDAVIADIAATTQAAVAAAPPEERNRAGIANLVRVIADDVRVGRLLFDTRLSGRVLLRKRAELGGFFALLSGQYVAMGDEQPDEEPVKAVAHFVVGGVGQTIGAWVAGTVEMTQAQLVDQLTGIVDVLAAGRRSASVLGTVTASSDVNSFVQQANSSVIPSGS